MPNNDFNKQKIFYIVIMCVLAVVLLVLVVIAGVTTGAGIGEPSAAVSADASELSVSPDESATSQTDLSADISEQPSAAEISEEISASSGTEHSEPVSFEQSEDAGQSSSEPVSQEPVSVPPAESSAEPVEESYDVSEPASAEESHEEVTWAPYSIKVSGVSANGKAFPASYATNNTTAKYVAVYNVTKGEFIYVKDAGVKTYPASMTKLVTAMLAEKYLPKDEKIIVGKEIEMVKPHSSLAYLYVGEDLPLETVLDAMLLPSGNDAAYVVGVNIGRKLLGVEDASLEDCLAAFCDEANRFVKKLGCKHTNITCPDGFHDPDHYTTAGDYAIISAEVVKNYPLVAKVCAKKRVKDGYKLEWSNTNNLLSEYSYVTGLKTGSTNEAGYCIAISAHAEGCDIVIIIMNCKTASNRTSDAKVLLNSAFGWY